MAKKNDKVRVAIVGIGNCANALVQGLQYYKDAAKDEEIPGLMHATVGGYHVNDIEISAAFDVVASKVGKDLSEAMSGRLAKVAVYEIFVMEKEIHVDRLAVG